MLFAFNGEHPSPWFVQTQKALRDVMKAHGHQEIPDVENAGLVFHLIVPDKPRPFRRKSQATFVVGVIPWDHPITEPLQSHYPLLVRSLSNLVLSGWSPREATFLVTPELGHYAVHPALSSNDWREELYERIAPLATSHLVIDNIFDQDLPEYLWRGTTTTQDMREASRILDSWKLFPTPYPVADILPAADLRHLRHVFGIGGLSYGNLSARHEGEQFWMSASGVDKGKIGTVSQDILLVKGYDAAENAMRISVAPHAVPLRVSVDAVEHWGIYRRHPEIGAIIHIHAWVEGIPSTTINYPCGTVEMGESMSQLLDQDPHPERTIIGLRNHGITATGPHFPDILERLAHRVLPQVPMQ